MHKAWLSLLVVLCISLESNQLSTLVYRIDVHARLLILRKKFPLHGLIWPCTFIVFEKKIPLHVYFSAFIRVFALHVY